MPQPHRTSNRNTTHRRALARSLAEATGLSYAQALEHVRTAADAGVLPARLEGEGMVAALNTLVGRTQVGTPNAAATAAPPGDGPAPAALWPAGFEPQHRTASDPADQEIFDKSYEYEMLTGHQGLVYISAPGRGADRYVFGRHHVALGRAEALSHVNALLNEARANPAPDRP